MIRPPPMSTLFPYTTRFRSRHDALVHRTTTGTEWIAFRAPSDGCPPPASTARTLSSAFPRLDGRQVSEKRCPAQRSEEHTSELQSRQYLVCRLLLEKKTACL